MTARARPNDEAREPSGGSAGSSTSDHVLQGLVARNSLIWGSTLSRGAAGRLKQLTRERGIRKGPCHLAAAQLFFAGTAGK